MRVGWSIAGFTPLAAACALTVSYEGYEKSSPNDASSGQGGSPGFGGGSFGGTGGVDGSLGGSGGLAGSTGTGGSGGRVDAGSCGGEDDCPVDEACVDWKCVGQRCVPDYLSGGECKAKECTGPAEETVYSCASGSCVGTPTSCGTFICSGNQCLTSCASSTECTGNLVCTSTQCLECQTCSEKQSNPGWIQPFCEPSSQTFWDALVACCQNECAAECSTAGVCGNGLGLPQPACSACLLDDFKCKSPATICSSDT